MWPAIYTYHLVSEEREAGRKENKSHLVCNIDILKALDALDGTKACDGVYITCTDMSAMLTHKR